LIELRKVFETVGLRLKKKKNLKLPARVETFQRTPLQDFSIVSSLRNVTSTQ